ncbi:xanthine dehydrogenase family protein molybdopterin-binding subunit [Marivibrio halodurans]|uniref:Xanthine dehydrogenase family protein molybdopterin-binding subunit n=1 Tax=Marivibrio halodurans TaxID=2039722 RepID=A0A8J7V3N9_9PROT|nr:xanthine dehydrogenase family protein molybdopterin-binding subunit [Marivibrio halodurans]MBP5858585.1 xanthine dehydrogenase family protein molybdopterin-binding subunit [Marivibrio halodurans]
MAERRYIGQSTPRVEDDALLRGKARFVDDLTAPGVLHAAFLRSPVAHARLLGLDLEEARAIPGVVAILTLADLKDVLTEERLPLQFISKTLPPDITPYVLAKDEMLYVGEPVAVVLADSRATAEDAASIIGIDLEEMTPVGDLRAAVEPDAPPVCSTRAGNVCEAFEVGYADVDAAFREAAHSVRLSMNQHRGGAHPIEGRGILAEPDAGGGLVVRSSTQLAHEARAFLVALLDLDENRLRVVTPDVGGGFGAKFLLYPEEVVASAAALLLGRPVKWIEDRREHFLAAIQERDQLWEIEAACDAEGRLLGVRGSMIHDAGAYVPQGINLAYNAVTAYPGPYVLPAYHMDVRVGMTNKVPTIPVRGAGYPEGTFAMERTLDALAARVGIDRVEIRRRNLVPAESIPYATPLKSRSGAGITYDSGDFPALLDQVLEAIDHAGFEARRAEAARAGRRLGIGVACGIKGTGRGPYESAIVRVGRSGKVTVFTGAMPMGQGLKTAMAQICGDALGLPPDRIEVICGDTGTIPLGIGGFASRQTVVAGSSVARASAAVREKAIRIAAHLLEADGGDIELVDGEARVKGTNVGIDLRAIAASAHGSPGYALPPGVDPGLEASENFMPKGLTYGMGAHAVEVAVDEETGLVTLTRYAVVNDCGRAINPRMVEAQIHGGVVHGIGNALFEYMDYDDQAQPVTTTLADYLMVTAPEVPRIDVRIAEYPSPLNPLGVKGVGEAGCLPVAPAIASAVEDALGVREAAIQRVPLSPPDLIDLLRARAADAA